MTTWWKKKSKFDKITTVINVIYGCLAACVFLVPQSYKILGAVFLPVMFIILLILHNHLYYVVNKNISKKKLKEIKGDRGEFPYIGTAFFCLLLAVIIRGLNMTGDSFYKIVFGIAAFLTVIVFLVHRKKMSVIATILIILFLLMGTYGAVGSIAMLGMRETHRDSAEVINKRSEGGSSSLRRFGGSRRKWLIHVRFSDGEEETLEVSPNEYSSLEPGDEVNVIILESFADIKSYLVDVDT